MADLGVRLADLTPEKVTWRSKGMIPRGKLVVLEGDPGLGKSTLLMAYAAAISRGDPLPRGEAQPERGVVLMCGEDGLRDTILPRFLFAGGDPRYCYALNDIPDEKDGKDRMPTIPRDIDALRTLVEQVEAGLVIIDPLSTYMDDELNETSNKDVRKALTPLARMAEDTGASIVVLRHLNKSGSVNALYRGGGSVGIMATSRVTLLIAPDPADDERKVLAVVKGNIGKKAKSLVYRIVGDPADENVSKIEWMGETDLTANDLLEGGVTPEEERDELSEAKDWLRDRLMKGPVDSKQIQRDANTAGISGVALKKAKVKIGARSRKAGYDGGWVWELKRLTVADDANVTPLRRDGVEYEAF